LGAREWRRSELTTFFVEWSVFTIALYTLGIALAFSIDWSGGFVGVLSMLPNLLSDLPAFVVGLVFAYIIGFLPALACAVLASRVAGKLAFAPIKDAR
jgi:prepilin signal peptidase PulO-like enzyme (type II secretory pathway)